MLSKCTVTGATETGADVRKSDGAGLMALVEQGEDAVVGLEAGHAWTDGENGAGAVGACRKNMLGSERDF